MPSQVNGIGTTYIGQQESSFHTGICESCRRTVQLLDYDTRLWFTFVFIPIIPLKKYHILDYCTSCTTHRAVPLEDWNRIQHEAISESLSGYSENIDDLGAAMKAHATLAAFGRSAEADQLADVLHQQFGEQVDWQLYRGVHHDRRGETAEAAACFERAYDLDPDNPDTIRSLGLTRLAQGDLKTASALLDPWLPPSEHFEPGVFVMLAQGHQTAGDHESALRYFKALVEYTPSLVGDKAFRGMVRKSEQAVGAAPSLVPKDRITSSTGFWIAAACAAALLCAVGFNLYTANNRELYVLNGLSEPLTVEIDGRRIVVPPHERHALTLAEGTHQCRWQPPGGVETQYSFTIQSDWFQRFGSSPAFFLDPSRSASLYWQQALYTANEEPDDPRNQENYILGAPFTSFVHIDYLFVDPPESIRVKDRKETVKKHVGVMDVPPEQFSVLGDMMLDRQDYLDLLERHAADRPRDEALLNVYLATVLHQGAADRGRVFLEQRLDERPVNVEWHRYYQQLAEAESEEAVLERYEKMLAADPNNPALLYLRARIEPLCGESKKYIEKALEVDPKNTFAWSLQGYRRLAQGQFDQAAEAYQKAIAGDDRPDLEEPWRQVRFAAGRHDELEQELKQRMEAEPLNLAAAQWRMKLAAQTGRMQDVGRIATEYRTQIVEQWPQDPLNFKATVGLFRNYLLRDLPAVLNETAEIEAPATREAWRFWANLEQGRLDQAEPALTAQGDAQAVEALLCLSWALRNQSQTQQADKWLSSAVSALARQPNGGRLAAAWLQPDGQPPTTAQALDLSMDAHLKCCLLIELARRRPQNRSPLLDLARRLNFDLGPPHFYLQQQIDLLTSGESKP